MPYDKKEIEIGYWAKVTTELNNLLKVFINCIDLSGERMKTVLFMYVE